MNKDEYAFLPEAFFGGVQEQEDEEELDPYFRPDAVSGEDEPDGLDAGNTDRAVSVLRRRDPRESFVGVYLPHVRLGD